MFNLEWQNFNSLRNYPFKQEASLSSNNGFILPKNFLIDLSCFFPSTGGSSFYISSINIEEDLTITLVFNNDAKSNISSDALPFSSFKVTGNGLSNSGKLVIGEGISIVRGWGTRVLEFTSSATSLETTTVLPVNLGVVTSVGILGRSEFLVGDVKFDLDRGMQADTIEEDNSIELSAIKRPEDCDLELNSCAIRSINDITPDQFGNINISGEGIVSIKAGAASSEGAPGGVGIQISSLLKADNLCPEPFEKVLRGTTGADGGPGPNGPPGKDLICICKVPLTPPPPPPPPDNGNGEPPGDIEPCNPVADLKLDSWDDNSANWTFISGSLAIIGPICEGAGTWETTGTQIGINNVVEFEIDGLGGGEFPGITAAPWDFSCHEKLQFFYALEIPLLVGFAFVLELTLTDNNSDSFTFDLTSQVSPAFVGFDLSPSGCSGASGEMKLIIADLTTVSGIDLTQITKINIFTRTTYDGIADVNRKFWFDCLELKLT